MPVCRPQTAAPAVSLVPPKPFGAGRSGSHSARLFQPAAAAAAAQTASAGQSATNADSSASSAITDSAAVPAVVYARHTAHDAHSQARLSNPYTQAYGQGMRGSIAQQSVPRQAQSAFSAASQQQEASLKSNAEASAMPTEHTAGAMQQLATAQLHAEGTQDLVTTYSSFNHDPVYPYAAFGAGSTASYTESGHFIDPVDSSAAIATVETHAEARQDTSQVSSNFDDMTELQL